MVLAGIADRADGPSQRSGYDLTSFVDFFEKIETLEKKKPGTLSKVFSSHPMT
jgi:predicted Zn-dependent protease